MKVYKILGIIFAVLSVISILIAALINMAFKTTLDAPHSFYIRMSRVRIIAFVITAVIIVICIALFVMYGKTKNTLNTNSDPIDAPLDNGKYDDMEILVIYETGVVATVGGDRFDRTMLCKDDKDKYYCVIVKDSDYSEKTETVYEVSKDVYEEVLKIAKKNKYESWSKKNYNSAIDGGYDFLKYINEKGEWVYVSTDNMPENGSMLMYEVCSAIRNMSGKEIEK